MISKSSIKNIIHILEKKYPTLPDFLSHKNDYEFLIAAILSAKTTDAMVNKITPVLFSKYKNVQELSQAKVEDVENIIRSVNYYKTKAKNIIETSKITVSEFNGKIPTKIEELVKLPGVGRKVANVILSDYYRSAQGFVVDTHIKRVTFRLGWTKNKNPTKIEKDIMRIIPKKYWVKMPKQLISIGREFCFPKNPDCNSCPLNKFCVKNILTN